MPSSTHCLEGRHWWFRARRLVLCDLLARLKWPQQPRILEIAVGPGYNLLEIYPPDAWLEGVEPDEVLAKVAAARSPVPVFRASVDRLPSAIRNGSYDGVTMFDVLEHIEDEAHALRTVCQKLRPGGRIVLSVPAYNNQPPARSIVQVSRLPKGAKVEIEVIAVANGSATASDTSG